MDAEQSDPRQPVNGPPSPPPATTLSGWVKQNAVQLAVIAAVIFLVTNFLQPLDVLLAGVGLSLIIFIHELGHFLAAKWCDVHVKTFSIGFGPPLPFCQFTYGETTYKLAMIPLGGFVAMVGEGDEHGDTVEPDDETEEEAKADPRNFKNKSVFQRMLIISAGVIMNIILGAVCFVATYLHGVEEKPAVVAHVEPGSAAWRAGIHVGTDITSINGRDKPFFDDIRPVVSSTTRGEQVQLGLEYRGKTESISVEPLRQEGAFFPQLGILYPEKLTLRQFRRDPTPPYTPGSPAASAKAADGGPGFLAGDRIVGISDPTDPAKVTPVDPNWNQLPGEFFDYHRRLVHLAGKPMTFHVVRQGDASNTPVPVVVAPAYHYDVGLRMRLGKVAAIRRNSPAEKAGIQTRQTDGDQTTVPGDRIVEVEVTANDGTATRFVAGSVPGPTDPKVKIVTLDPLRLPDDLNRWSDSNPSDRKVKVTVLREVEHTEKRVEVVMEWDPSYRYENSTATGPGTPVPLNGLGLAYHVQAVVDGVTPNSPGATAGLQPDDKVLSVRFKGIDGKGKEVVGNWDDVLPHQWAFVDYKLQRQAPHQFDAKIERGGQTIEVSLNAVEDKTWPVVERGLELMPETRTQKADGIVDALQMGAQRTVRSVKMVYLGLYSMVFGRISVKMMSGPITLARASYIIAGEDIWHLLIWMGLISINLAVVNFLPIPVLDGGHMVFLIYEWIRGKPAPIPVQAALTYVGLALIGSMMLFVIGLDIWRLFFA